jgi:very-short-patch-repair endonuclease
MSLEQRAKLSAAKLGTKTGPSSEAKKLKQRESWALNYEARCESIKNRYTDERRELARVNQKRVIAERGYHLARGRETRLERLVREHFENLGYWVKKQKQTRDLVLGAKRYFDVYVQELNLIVEADGEYWHTREDRIAIDEGKEAAAFAEGYNFIRVSDALLKRGAEHAELARLLSLTQDEARTISASLIQNRRAKLAAHQVQV